MLQGDKTSNGFRKKVHLALNINPTLLVLNMETLRELIHIPKKTKNKQCHYLNHSNNTTQQNRAEQKKIAYVLAPA